MGDLPGLVGFGGFEGLDCLVVGLVAGLVAGLEAGLARLAIAGDDSGTLFTGVVRVGSVVIGSVGFGSVVLGSIVPINVAKST